MFQSLGGRPPQPRIVEDVNKILVAVRLSHTHRRIARKAGNGNISEGIRMGLDLLAMQGVRVK